MRAFGPALPHELRTTHSGVAVVVVWQLLATWRTRMTVTRDEEYRGLAEQTARELADIKDRVGDGQDAREEEENEH
jgi:hypothetical protein